MLKDAVTHSFKFYIWLYQTRKNTATLQSIPRITFAAMHSSCSSACSVGAASRPIHVRGWHEIRYVQDFMRPVTALYPCALFVLTSIWTTTLLCNMRLF